MRVALAAARRLEALLRRIESQASFQYTQILDESVGALTGRLDVPRYHRTRLRPESPKRYPIRVIERRYSTPENVLAAYAALWVLHEFAEAPVHLIPNSSPEYREISDRRASLTRIVGQPFIHQSTEDAGRTRRRRELSILLDRVEQRLDAGHIAGREVYRELVDWARTFNPDASLPEPGSVEWAFYDDRFDTKLFEVWALTLLIEALNERFGVPPSGVQNLSERTRRAMVTWNLGAGKVKVFFQAGLTRLGVEKERWHFVEPKDAPLGGIPDLGVVIERFAGERVLVLVDPKLRQRDTSPSDELYKILGYFGNLPQFSAPLGTIVFYSPGQSRLYRLKDESQGHLLAIGVDPADDASSAALFAHVADLVVGASGLSIDTIAKLKAAGQGQPGEIEELATAVQQEAVVNAMQQAAAVLPAPTLDPVRKTTAANLHEIWGVLSEGATTMVVTAEYFGQTAPDDADHSGPLLGLAASCEVLLYELFFDQVIDQNPGLFLDTPTLGSLIHYLHDASFRHQRMPEGGAVRDLLDHRGLDIGRVRDLVKDLRTLNWDFRIPAAHRDVISQGVWVTGRSFILAPQSGLLSRLVALFGA
jgi:hypothetical protein